MRIITITTIIIINFILQTSLSLEIFGISPNTSIILIVSFSILRYEVEGGIIGFFAGLLQDIFFGTIIGFNALLYMLIGFFSGKPFKEFYAENYLLPLTLVGISTIFFNLSYYIFNFLFRARMDIVYYLWSIILPSTLYNLAITLPLYILLYIINSKLEKHEKPYRKLFNKN